MKRPYFLHYSPTPPTIEDYCRMHIQIEYNRTHPSDWPPEIINAARDLNMTEEEANAYLFGLCGKWGKL